MIEIIEKPDYISWESIHDTIWEAHSPNREKGVVMSFPSLPGFKLKEKIESGNGKIFLAMDANKIVGTAAYTIADSKYWFCRSKYLYLCLASVLPEYNGMGIYKQLYICRERERERLGIPVVVFETHEKNRRMISINTRNGFHKVKYKACKDHNNVIMAKWYEECPFSCIYIKWRFFMSFIRVRISHITKML